MEKITDKQRFLRGDKFALKSDNSLIPQIFTFSDTLAHIEIWSVFGTESSYHCAVKRAGISEKGFPIYTSILGNSISAFVLFEDIKFL